jgi:hypothetical protein
VTARSFDVGTRPRIQVKLGAGSVRVVQGEPGSIGVDVQGRGADTVIMEQAGDLVSVRQEDRLIRGSIHVTFTAPEGVSLSAGLASADLEVEVLVEDLNVSVASGDVRVGRIEREAVVKTASGDVEIEALAGKGRLNSASGDVRIVDALEDATVNTASGHIDITRGHRDLRLRSASGDIAVHDYRGADIATSTISGDVLLGLPQGRSVDVELRTLSGRISLPSAPSSQEQTTKTKVRVRFKSVSGDFELTTKGS